MKPVARLTDMHDCPVHGLNAVTSVLTRSRGDGMRIATVGDMTACGAIITTGTDTCIIDGRKAAIIGSRTSHGGVIVSGSQTLKG
ncbi:PAAR domain-containing protein [Paracoccus kondratievae]|uniref:PAAR domain-containing protein n=1 Tax=Paracoccus kondratievae TaxID=135740 RepID=A0AAD3P119_9RHOB|nr:hypothetical protein GCM10017635_28050 [Paracoccus kondratievae]